MTQLSTERRFDHGAWLHLILTSALILFVIATAIYRFTLPTDGWLSAEPEDFNGRGFIYETNVMGLESALEPGDYLIAVEGITLTSSAMSGTWPLRDIWQSGNRLNYTIQRGDATLELEQQLTTWDLATYWRGAGQSVADLVGYAGLVVFLIVAFVAFWRSPSNPAARALWVLAAVVFATFIATDLLPNMVPDSVDPVSTLALLAIITALFTVLLPPAFIRFALVFPKPSPLLEKRPWLAFLPYLIGSVVMVAFAFNLFVFGWLWTAASVLIAIAILVHNAIVSRDAVSRAQLRWGLGGMIVGLGFFFLATYAGIFVPIPDQVRSVFDIFGALSFGIMGVTLGIAVMRYRLFDIDVIIRRTTSYALLTALLVLVYFGSVVVLQRLLSPITGESTIAIVLSTLLIAALFLPLRRRVQAAIDKRFFRQKYDAEQVLAQFAATVRDETDLDELTAELVRVIQETMQPEFVSVWLRPGWPIPRQSLTDNE